MYYFEGNSIFGIKWAETELTHRSEAEKLHVNLVLLNMIFEIINLMNLHFCWIYAFISDRRITHKYQIGKLYAPKHVSALTFWMVEPQNKRQIMCETHCVAIVTRNMT